jgi:hypothetical protein
MKKDPYKTNSIKSGVQLALFAINVEYMSLQ